MDKVTPSGMTPGSPAGSYALSGFDNVNLFNGNLNFRLPLLGIGGRGGAGYQIMLAVNLKRWSVKHFNKVTADGNEINTHTPRFLGGGLSAIGASPGYLSAKHIGIMTAPGTHCYFYSTALTRLIFSTSDGTEYELRDQLTGGQPLGPPSCTQEASRGTVFVTTDGTSATFVSDTTIYD